MALARDGKYVDYLAVADAPDKDAAQAERKLKVDSIIKLVMLSGDKENLIERGEAVFDVGIIPLS